MKTVVWFRNDLRLHDHAPLYEAAKSGQILAVYCIDPRQWGRTSFGFEKTGTFRRRFVVETAKEWKTAIESRGGKAFIFFDEPETVLPEVFNLWGADKVFFHAEAGTEEQYVAAKIKKLLPAVEFEGRTLLAPEDLPFLPAHTPDLFTEFRRRVEHSTLVRPPLPVPETLAFDGEIALHPPPIPSVPDVALTFPPGETAALARLNHYLFETQSVSRYKLTRNGLDGMDYSSKLSPYLAVGALSPRTVFRELEKYESRHGKNDSTYWLFFELLWRDFFYFTARKHGARLFKAGGIRNLPIPWRNDERLFEAWRTGTTGYPLVDACMRQLAQTGYMSNRGRQIVASFLTKNLELDWRLGAEWFESLLIDYDVASNYGNWNYCAGVGNDARGFRYFDVGKQAAEHDPTGDFVRKYVPELAQIRPPEIFFPLSPSAQRQTGYPPPVCSPDSVKRSEGHYLRSLEQAEVKGAVSRLRKFVHKNRREK
jgi:deoxyribodipyrimidine photo-lyase